MSVFETFQFSLVVLCLALVSQLMYLHFAQDSVNKEYQRKVDEIWKELKIESERRDFQVNGLRERISDTDRKIDDIAVTAQSELDKMTKFMKKIVIRLREEEQSTADWENSFIRFLNSIGRLFNMLAGSNRRRITHQRQTHYDDED